MEKEKTQLNQTGEIEAVVSGKSAEGGNGKLNLENDGAFDISKYKKRWIDNLDRRFLSIFFASLVFNVILILYISNIPFQITADYIKKFQEHYANFIYDKQIETVDVKDLGDKALIGEGAKDQGEKPEGSKDQAGGKGGRSGGSAPAGTGTGEATAEARRAAHTKSTQEIQQEVSNKGLLGLLTGSGSAAQGEAIQDVLSSSPGGGSKNLDEVLSGLSGIKTQGTPGGSGNGSGAGARGSRTSGSGTGIGDMIDGLTSAKSQNFGQKTDKMVVSESKIEVEGGKAGGRESESVMAVVNSHRAAIEYCYQRALRKNPNLKGKISLRFSISPAGQVKSVEILANTLNDSSVEKCIISKIKSWRDFGPVDPSKGDAVFRQDYIFGY